MNTLLRRGAAVVGALFVLTAVGCTGNDDVIVMGTNATFPPFEYIGGAEGDEVVGFDVEIAEEIAADLGRELRIEDMEFDTLLTALNANKVDFVMAGMTINPTRAESVTFSEPYYEATQAVLVRRDDNNVSTLDDLRDTKISVQLGTTGNGIASELTAEENISAFNSAFEAVMELKNGKVDSLIIDRQPALNFLAKNEDLLMVDVAFDPEFYGIATRKGDTELAEAINATLTRIQESGRYDELIAEYME